MPSWLDGCACEPVEPTLFLLDSDSSGIAMPWEEEVGLLPCSEPWLELSPSEDDPGMAIAPVEVSSAVELSESPLLWDEVSVSTGILIPPASAESVLLLPPPADTSIGIPMRSPELTVEDSSSSSEVEVLVGVAVVFVGLGMAMPSDDSVPVLVALAEDVPLAESEASGIAMPPAELVVTTELVRSSSTLLRLRELLLPSSGILMASSLELSRLRLLRVEVVESFSGVAWVLDAGELAILIPTSCAPVEVGVEPSKAELAVAAVEGWPSGVELELSPSSSPMRMRCAEVLSPEESGLLSGEPVESPWNPETRG